MNIINIRVFMSKRLKKMCSRNCLIILSIGNIFSIPNILIVYIYQVWKLDVSAVSSLYCKLIRFAYYASSPILAYILVYISIDRYYYVINSKSFKSFTQIATMFCIVIFNIIYNSPYLFQYEVLTFQIPVPNQNFSKNSR